MAVEWLALKRMSLLLVFTVSVAYQSIVGVI